MAIGIRLERIERCLQAEDERRRLALKPDPQAAAEDERIAALLEAKVRHYWRETQRERA